MFQNELFVSDSSKLGRNIIFFKLYFRQYCVITDKLIS